MAPRRWLRIIQRASHIALLLTAWFGLASVYASSLEPGLTVQGWSIDEIPPDRSLARYAPCGSAVVDQIDATWDWAAFEQCGWDRFMLRFTGAIQMPADAQSIRFAIASDDGGLVNIGGHQFGQWRDQSCFVTYSDRVAVSPGSLADLEAWFYENGGGTCFTLFWQINSDANDWNVVPASAFHREMPPTTTTTTMPPEPSTQPPLEETTTTTELIPSTTMETTTSAAPPADQVENTTTSTAIQTIQTTTTILPISPPTMTTASSAPPTTTSTIPTTSVVDPGASESSSTTTTIEVAPDDGGVLPETSTSLATITQVNGGSVGRGMKQAALVSRGLRDGVSAGQQRAIVAGAVLIAMPSAFRPRSSR